MQSTKGIASFYDGKTIFLTGGSGFLGKVLIEKLLRSCPGIKKILLMLRTKKGRSAEERVKSLFNSEVRSMILFFTSTNISLKIPYFLDLNYEPFLQL